MAQPAEALRQLVHELDAHEPLGESGRSGSVVRQVAKSAGRTHRARVSQLREHDCQDLSRWHRCSIRSGPQAIGPCLPGWSTKIQVVAAAARCAIASPTARQAGDAPAGRDLLGSVPELAQRCRVFMNRAHEGNGTRPLALDLGFIPVVPPLCTRVDPWSHSKNWSRCRGVFASQSSRTPNSFYNHFRCGKQPSVSAYEASVSRKTPSSG